MEKRANEYREESPTYAISVKFRSGEVKGMRSHSNG